MIKVNPLTGIAYETKEPKEKKATPQSNMFENNPAIDQERLEKRKDNVIPVEVFGQTRPLSHTNDPPAAKEGEEHITSTGKAEKHRQIVHKWVKDYPLLTVQELWKEYRNRTGSDRALKDFSALQKRHSDIFRKELIKRVGERICTVTGQRAGVFATKGNK